MIFHQFKSPWKKICSPHKEHTNSQVGCTRENKNWELTASSIPDVARIQI